MSRVFFFFLLLFPVIRNTVQQFKVVRLHDSIANTSHYLSLIMCFIFGIVVFLPMLNELINHFSTTVLVII